MSIIGSGIELRVFPHGDGSHARDLHLQRHILIAGDVGRAHASRKTEVVAIRLDEDDAQQRALLLGMGIALIFTLYAIVTVLSIGGGYLPTYFVDKKGMNPYIGRMRAMLIFACFPLLGLLGAGHQAWSANLYSTIGDMFPKSTVATITGIGAMAGGVGSFLINKGSGMLFTYAEGQGSAFSFMGFEGKPAGYMIIFCICAVAYLIGWCIMKALVPKYKPIVVE